MDLHSRVKYHFVEILLTLMSIVNLSSEI